MIQNITPENLALEIAKDAGEIIKNNFKLGMKKDWKSNDTPVTTTDITINKLVIEKVKKYFPNHSVLGEEESNYDEKNEYCWVCDPVDGTIPFSHGVPIFTFSLALTKNGSPILGIIYDPILDRLFFAKKDKGSTLNGKKINVSNDINIKNKVIGLCTWATSNYPIHQIQIDLENKGTLIMNPLSIAYMGTLVANGEFAATIFSGSDAHDSAAIKIIVEEAGGKVTDLYGNEQRYDRKTKGHISSNGIIHDELVKLIRPYLKNTN